MESEINQEEVQVEQKSQLYRVTPLSKYLAMVIFILMPFVGGWVGYTYAPEKVVEVERVVVVEKVVEVEKIVYEEVDADKDLLQQEVSIPEGWNLVINKELGIQFNHPSDWTISEVTERESIDGVPIKVMTAVPSGMDPTIVYFFTTTVSLEEAKTIAIVATPTTEPLFNSVNVNGVVGVQRIDGDPNNGCTQITALIEKSGTTYGSNIFNCPTHPEGYDKLRNVTAASLQIL